MLSSVLSYREEYAILLENDLFTTVFPSFTPISWEVDRKRFTEVCKEHRISTHTYFKETCDIVCE